MELEEVWMTNV